jgi:hypothetical protein
LPWTIVVAVSIDVRIAATPGLVTIAPPGQGDVLVPRTRLRVPAVVDVTVDPAGEGAEYTPLRLELRAGLMDQSTGCTLVGGPWSHAAPDVPRIGDWKYEVARLVVSPTDDTPVTPSGLAAIRIPGLLRRSLRHLVLLVTDAGYTIDPSDLDERAVAAYVTAQLVGEHPTKAVAAELGANSNAAAQRVHRLRAAGRLPAVPGRGTH